MTKDQFVRAIQDAQNEAMRLGAIPYAPTPRRVHILKGQTMPKVTPANSVQAQAAADQPLPTLDTIRTEERPTPPVADLPPFQLSQPIDQREEQQRDLFNEVRR